MDLMTIRNEICGAFGYEYEKKDYGLSGKICKMHSDADIEEALEMAKRKNDSVPIIQPVLYVWKLLSNNRASQKASTIIETMLEGKILGE